MTIKEILKSRKIRSFLMSNLGFIPDSIYISLFYYAATGKWPNLRNPKGFSEKLNWLKLHGDYSKYVDYCDKIKVRDIIKKQLGDGYMFPILGKWKRFEDIDFDTLPEKFVLKCNHDSGSVKIIQSKSSLTDKDKQELKKFYNNRLKYDFFVAGREPCYIGIEPYIIAEPFMTLENNKEIKDYKFFCFDGVPKLVLIVGDRNFGDHCEDYVDTNYNWYPEITNGYHSSKVCPTKPVCFDEMVDIVRKLCKGIKCVRIDMYVINNRIYFGEYTFFNGGGFEPFKPAEWEKKLGDLIELPTDK